MVLAAVLAVARGLSFQCLYSLYNSNGKQFYSCSITLVDDGRSDLTAVTGTHLDGMTNSDVTDLVMGQNYNNVHVYKLPTNIASYFPNLQTLSWSQADLQTVTVSDLKPFPNLRVLDLSYNFIRRLDGDLFQYNPHIETILFYSDSIEYVGKGIFNNCNAIKTVYLGENVCISYGHQSWSIGPNYSIADMEADLIHLCGPLDSPGVCSADCTKRFDAIEGEISSIETHLTAPWYEKSKWFFKTAFGL